MRPRYWWVWVVASFGARPASADNGATVSLEAVPMLGPGSPVGEGWAACALDLTNSSSVEAEGTVELVSELAWNDSRNPVVTRAPFRLPPKGRVHLELPTHGFQGYTPRLLARALDGQGRELASVNLADPSALEPLLFELEVPSRLGPALRDAGLFVPLSPTRGKSARPSLSVGTPQVESSSGELVLPERPAGYASATVVLARTETLVGLGGPRLEALADWVLGGGALALVVTRPEDLHSPPVRALVGAEAQPGEPRDDWMQLREFERPTDPSERHPASAGRTARTERAAPGAAVAAKLTSYSGGNLRPSAWGSSASYGLGEVHLLAFDATREPAVSDAWVKLELLDLVRHAWLRQRHVALAHGRSALDRSSYEAVRRQLDPNEGNRWAIAVATLVLLLYAVLAGPVNFFFAARKGRPLKALRYLPVWSALAVGTVVSLGVIARGPAGRARHLSLIEAGAGMPRASITRFRAFYASSAADLWVHASHRTSVLDLVGPEANAQRVLFVDRDGARLGRLGARPWEALVVREDDFVNLGQGVTLVDRGGLEVHNRTGRDLLGVVVKSPDSPTRYWPKIAAGQRVRFDSGAIVPGLAAGPRSELEARTFAERVGDDLPGLGAAWMAIESVVSSDTWWWPDDVPVLLAELGGGEGRSFDAGLRLEADRLLIRVVGWGGRS